VYAAGALREIATGAPGDVRVFALASELTAAQTDYALAHLSSAERARYDSDVASVAQRFLAGRFLLRTAVAEVTGCSPADVRVSATCEHCGAEHGQPRVAIEGLPGHRQLSVSLAHTQDQHVVALSDVRDVGIDVEALREEDLDEARIAVDISAYRASGRTVLGTWVCYEAACKVVGRGISDAAAGDGSTPMPDEVELWEFRTQEVVGALATYVRGS